LTKRGIVNLQKQDKKPKMKSKPHRFSRIRPGLAAMALSLLILGFATAPNVQAVNYQSQINALNSANANAQASINNLQVQAGSYQQAITNYQNQINAIQNSINVNQAKLVADQQEIIADNAKIALNKGYLANDLKTMYVQGSMSTIEELATSQNLSTFVNKQEDNLKIQDQLNSLLTTIKSLQQQAQANKNQITILMNLEQSQKNQIAADENQVSQLLSMNQQQQSSYNAQISANKSQIATLVAEQIAANKRLVSTGKVDYSGTCGGSYPAAAQGPYGPWGCNYAHSSDFQPGCTYMDNWGMCNRECVSYTAWMVYKNYGIDVTGFGNANQWPANAQAVGIPTGSTPKVGSVAIYMGGYGDPYGHAMWVKSVNGNGTITVDQYNLYYDGNFYETTISPSGLTYIYFGG
jgi:surface antigen/peptidoglycan hydrolase CwlO-like protein